MVDPVFFFEFGNPKVTVHKAKGHTQYINVQKLYEEIRYLNFCLKEVKGNVENI